MRLEDSLIMLSDGYEYGINWLKKNEKELEGSNVKEVIKYIEEKDKRLSKKLQEEEYDRAFEEELDKYYKKVGEIVIDPIAFIPLMVKTEGVDYLSYINSLAESIMEGKVEEGEMTVKQFIDVVMKGSELGKELDKLNSVQPKWYDHLNEYSRKAMAKEMREWFKKDDLTAELKKQLSPFNLYKLVWDVGHSGINVGHHGQEYRSWIKDFGFTGHPTNVELKQQVNLYKWFKGYVMRDKIQSTERMEFVSVRIMRLLGEEVNKGTIQAGDIKVEGDGRGVYEAIKVGDYTAVFLGRLEIFEMNKEVRVDLKAEMKVLDRSVSDILVRDMKKIVKLMVKKGR